MSTNPQRASNSSPAPGRPSATIAAWCSTFGALASASGSIDQAPGRALDVTPDGDPQSPTGHQDAVGLGDGVGRRPPDPAKAGDDVEGGVGPGKVLHVADAKVGMRVAIAGHGDQPWRCVDAGTRRAHRRRQLHGESGAAGHVEQTVTRPDAEVMVEGHVLPAVRRLTEGGEVDGAPAPALVDLAPGRRRVAAGVRRVLRHGRRGRRRGGH